MDKPPFWFTNVVRVIKSNGMAGTMVWLDRHNHVCCSILHSERTQDALSDPECWLVGVFNVKGYESDLLGSVQVAKDEAIKARNKLRPRLKKAKSKCL